MYLNRSDGLTTDAGETLVITEHRRPIAEVHAYNSDNIPILQASGPFTLAGTAPQLPVPGIWESLLNGERGEH